MCVTLLYVLRMCVKFFRKKKRESFLKSFHYIQPLITHCIYGFTSPPVMNRFMHHWKCRLYNSRVKWRSHSAVLLRNKEQSICSLFPSLTCSASARAEYGRNMNRTLATTGRGFTLRPLCRRVCVCSRTGLAMIFIHGLIPVVSSVGPNRWNVFPLYKI
jgi:hypothetical protein